MLPDPGIEFYGLLIRYNLLKVKYSARPENVVAKLCGKTLKCLTDNVARIATVASKVLRKSFSSRVFVPRAFSIIGFLFLYAHVLT